jgi:hypothetical protein
VVAARLAIAARDWSALRPLLHPYLRWTGSDGMVLRGRSNVLSVLEQADLPTLPSIVELRDGQIYRCQSDPSG